MVSAADYAKNYGIKSGTELQPAEENNEISTFKSAMAGIGSGLFKIPEGFISTGAMFYDLFNDTDKAAEVEKYFADINPFDEMAEATAAGRITELIVNIGVPGGFAAKAASSIARAGIVASQSGRLVNLGTKAGKEVVEAIGKKAATKVAPQLTKTGKAITFGSGALGAGVAEGIFVADTEDAGTFGDLIGGFTELDRGLEGTDYDPGRELLNRLKFGTEGALFAGAIGGAGVAIKKLRNADNAGQVVNGRFNKWLDKWVSQPFRSRGKQTKEAFQQERKLVGAEASDQNVTETIVRELDGQISKLFPFFKRAIGDKTVDAQRKSLLRQMNKVLLSSERNANKLDPIIETTTDATGELIEKVRFGAMNTQAMNEFTEQLSKLGAKADDIEAIKLNLGVMRSGWGDLFSSMGRRLDANGAQEFRTLFGDKVTTWLDSTYDVFKNRKSKVGELYTPTAQVMESAKASFKQLYRDNVGKELSDAAAQKEVLKVYNSAGLEEGFKLNSKSDPYFQVPDFFLGKSAADDALKVNDSRLAEMTGVQKQVIEDLFGKGNDAFQTILNGTNKLSGIVRRNEYFDNLLNTSNELRAAGKTPTFANSRDEAARLFGGIEDVDWKAITPVEATKAGIKGIEPLDRFLDYKQTLKPLKGERKPLLRGEVDMELPIHNPLQTKYALVGTVDSIVKPINEMAAGKSLTSQIYQNLILYPKATSQMAKTILSPFTHARNFVSAGAFAMANGIIPFSDPQAVKQAFNALQVAGPGTRKSNEFYQKLLRLGVVNSQVQLGDLQNLLRDVNFGGVTGKLASADNLASYGLNRLLKGLSKVKKFSEDAYTAEDDFWKIFSFLGESKRLKNAYEKAGLNLGQEFTDMAGNTVRLTDDLIDEQAADIIRNNIPNYAYVSEFVKGLRKFPLGNFVSFPAEIMRTSTNIVSRSLDEIFYTTTINGKQVNPFRTIGLKRLGGMAFTTAAVPAGIASGMSALYNVTQDERAAMRRFVADWSKNSTLIPIRDKETGKLKYVDFSHANAYDTITRPIQTILNRVQAGETDKNGLMDDFIMGMIESTKELGSPFVSESIWTQALMDVAPVLGRNGRTPEGYKVWSNQDPIGTKVSKAVGHLIQSQAPLNWKQLKRIGLSMKPTDDRGRLDDRGRQYELSNELMGIVGARAIEIEPEKSMIYKTADYLRGARESKALFSTVALRGGEVTPTALVDAYINANRALFSNQKELLKDVQAATTLKGDMRKIGSYVSGKIGKKNYGAIRKEMYVPYVPSKNVFRKSREITRDIQEVDPNYRDPLRDILPLIANIRRQLFRYDLNDMFPEIENPLNLTLGSEILNTVQAPLINLGFLGENNIIKPPMTVDPVTGLTSSEEVLLDPMEKMYRKNQRKTNKPV
ncbi:hypothetical protein [phage 023Pt_psg01]|nr:hypothetical protein [phage 023Pt_psg01]